MIPELLASHTELRELLLHLQELLPQPHAAVKSGANPPLPH
jgi:hypothetical protein